MAKYEVAEGFNLVAVHQIGLDYSFNQTLIKSYKKGCIKLVLYSL
jgi:hypothetical protein